MTRPRTKLLFWLSATGLLLGAGVVPPLVNADRFAGGIQAGLERELGRRVTVGAVRVHLLPTPGFSASDVVIGEDPAWGLEPVAYVTTLVARPKLSSLWTGRLEFASLHLEEPSINLARVLVPGGSLRWNFEPLLSRATEHLPDVEVDDGRVNFRFDGRKSEFYFSSANASVSPPSAPGGDWRLQFSGEPARTDRPARGFGRLEGSGRLRAAGVLDLDVRLDKSAIVDMITLVYGSDAGLHGLCSARLRATGPLDDLKVSGSVQIEDIHRWDMMPPHGGGWALTVQGRAALRSQVLDLRASPAGASPAVALRFRATDYLGDPHWGMVANFQGVPVAPLVEMSRHMGVPIPQPLAAEGVMDGAIGYSRAGGFEGRMGFSGAALGLPSGPSVGFERAVLVFDGPRVELLPTVARTGEDEVRIEGAYFWNTRLLDLTVGTDGMPVASPGSRAVLSMVPLLREAASGWWRGQLRSQWPPDGTAAWTGHVGLEEVELPVPGLARPVHLEWADLRLHGPRVAVEGLQALIGGTEVLGEYHYEPRLSQPHRFHLAIPELSASDAEELLLPTLRRRRGFLARTLGIGSGVSPDWLKAWHAEGVIRIGSLEIGGIAAEQVRARVLWDGETVEIAGLEARVLGGSLHGAISVDLKGPVPAYRFNYQLKEAEWKNGAVNSEGTLRTSGTGIETLRNLTASGSFEGRELVLDPETAVDAITGSFRAMWRGGFPVLDFADLEASLGEARYAGKGATGAGGELLVELSDGTSEIRLTGTLEQLKIDRDAR